MTDSIAASEPAGERLKRLAEAHGVSTEYWDYHGNLAAPSRATLVAVLAALGVKASTEEHMGFTGRGEGIAAHAVCLLTERTR